MKTTFVEATSTDPVSGAYGNHGKFMVACFEDEEWERPSEVDRAHDGTGTLLLHRTGWGRQSHFLVADLQTGEGAIFSLGGYAKADLDKHGVWVCPLFEPFLEWLYERWNEWRAAEPSATALRSGAGPIWQEVFLDELPAVVNFERAVEFAGYRRKGPYVTKSGKVLTDADIERLADDAERGYDVSKLKDAPNRRVVAQQQMADDRGTMTAERFAESARIERAADRGITRCADEEPLTAGDASSWTCVLYKGHLGDHTAANGLTTWPQIDEDDDDA